MGKRKENGEPSKKFLYSKYYLFAFHIAALILALAILTLALYIRYEWDFKHYVIELQAYQIWTGPIILMVTSCCVILLAFFGCWATAHENPFLLFVFIIVNIVLAIVEVAGAAYALNHGVLWSALTPWLEDRFLYLVHEAYYNERSARIVRIMEEDLGCCASTGWQNYDDFHKPIPSECRNPLTGNMYVYGCSIIFSDFVEIYMAWLAGMTLLLVALQIFATIAAAYLRKMVKKAIKREDQYAPVRTSKI